MNTFLLRWRFQNYILMQILMAPKFENNVPIQFKKFILYKYISIVFKYCDVLETHQD